MRRRLLGPEAVERAVADGAPVRVVLVRRGAGATAARAAEAARAAGARVIVTSEREIARLAGQGAAGADVLGVAGPDPAASFAEALREDGPAWLVAGLAYPGNVGLALRTAEVSGAVAVAVAPPLDGAARRAALRASIGAHRFLPVAWTSVADALGAARAAGRRVVALEASGTRAPWEADLRGRVLFVAGGEREGVPPEALAAADEVVRLPTAGAIPSYNVAAAVTAVAVERARQDWGRSPIST